jgi:flagellin
MGFRINTNVAALSAQKNIADTSRLKQDLSAKLSSGNRITKSADDAAGLAISEKLKASIGSSRQADRNANDGISLVQVAEGSLGEVSGMLTRLRELSIQSASDTIGDEERGFADKEYQQLLTEIDRVAQSTEFNGRKLLNGEGDELSFHVGLNNDKDVDTITYDSASINSSTDSLGINGLSISSKEDAQDGLENIDEAISGLSAQRSDLGAMQNRLVVTSSNIQTSIENLSAANSRIRDVDYAQASSENARLNILESAGTAVLSQANVSKQNALRLIG